MPEYPPTLNTRAKDSKNPEGLTRGDTLEFILLYDPKNFKSKEKSNANGNYTLWYTMVEYKGEQHSWFLYDSHIMELEQINACKGSKIILTAERKGFYLKLAEGSPEKQAQTLDPPKPTVIQPAPPPPQEEFVVEQKPPKKVDWAKKDKEKEIGWALHCANRIEVAVTQMGKTCDVKQVAREYIKMHRELMEETPVTADEAKEIIDPDPPGFE